MNKWNLYLQTGSSFLQQTTPPSPRGLLSPPALIRVSHSHLACEITLSSQGAPSTRHALSLPRSVSSNSNWLSDESIIIPLGCSQQMGRCHSLSIFIVPIRLTLSQPLIINLSTCEARPVALSPVPTTRRSRWFYWVSAILHVHDTSFLSHARWLALPPER